VGSHNQDDLVHTTSFWGRLLNGGYLDEIFVALCQKLEQQALPPAQRRGDLAR
jgi:hypothetical protein